MKKHPLILLVFLVSLFLFSCENEIKKLKPLYGLNYFNEFYINDSCKSCNNEFYSMMVDENSDVMIFDYKGTNQYQGNYLIDHKNATFEIKNNGFRKLNGLYKIKFDTIYSNSLEDELKITLKSKHCKIVCQKIMKK